MGGSQGGSNQNGKLPIAGATEVDNESRASTQFVLSGNSFGTRLRSLFIYQNARLVDAKMALETSRTAFVDTC